MDERARLLSGARDLPVLAVMTGSKLGAVFGRDHVVHVAVAAGALGPAAGCREWTLCGADRRGRSGPAGRSHGQVGTGGTMSEGNDQDQAKGRLSLRPASRLELGRTVDAGSVRQSFSHGRSKVVQVEVRKKRGPGPTPAPGTPGQTPASSRGAGAPAARPAGAGRALTASELATRQRVLEEQQKEAARRDAERREQEKISVPLRRRGSAPSRRRGAPDGR